jgi:acyl-CoA thioester hydrolase
VNGGSVLEDFPVIVKIPVRWGDQDALAHVNHIMYLQYFETARIEYLLRLGMEAPGPSWRESGGIIASVTCRYLAPVTFPDTLYVAARVAHMGGDRITMEHAAFSERLEKPAARSTCNLVWYDYVAGRRRPIPAEITAAIITLEGHEPPPPPAH